MIVPEFARHLPSRRNDTNMSHAQSGEYTARRQPGRRVVNKS
jgi:hypothetical protein